jgi:hypothetical protein
MIAIATTTAKKLGTTKDVLHACSALSSFESPPKACFKSGKTTEPITI